MSDVVENISEQNSAPSIEAAQPTEVVSEKISNNVEAGKEAVPAAIENVSVVTPETVEESLPKPTAEESSSTSPKVDNKKTPAKRTPSKRMSFIERAQKESEELVRTLGGSLELEGGRRTRSSTRGTPTRSTAVSTPPPTKKSRTSPASGASTPTRRGRGRKLDSTADGSAEEETSPTTSKKKTPAKGRKSAAAAKDSVESQLEDEKQHADETDEKKSDDDHTLAADTTKEDNVDSVAPTKPDIVETEATEVVDEIKTESNTETKVDQTETENNVNDEEAHKVDDEPDIVVLESVVEETQSQVAAETSAVDEEVQNQVMAETSVVEDNITKEPENVIIAEKKVEEPTKNYSPMETEEECCKPVECEENEKQEVVELTSETNEIKEPTPEPMEVDSSSKSNDDLEKMEETITDDVVEQQTQLSAPVENTEHQNKEVESQQSTVTVTEESSSTNASNLNNVNIVEDNIQQNTLATDEIVTPASDTVELNSIGAKLVNEPAATNAAFANENSTEQKTTTPAANDSNKTENDLCEPKIATSPPISAANDNSTVTTPQTCN